MFARRLAWSVLRRGRYAAPILKIFVPHTGQRPCVAGRPFFIVIDFASLISREALHFTQYPVATGHLHTRVLNAAPRAKRTPREAAGIVPPTLFEA
jgi:hypothetical protein